eukprot:1258584-Prymnesium_polylepis.1
MDAAAAAAAVAAAAAASNMPLPSARARMVVLAGARHVRGRVGVPNRFSRRTAEPTFSMVSLQPSLTRPAARKSCPPGPTSRVEPAP